MTEYLVLEVQERNDNGLHLWQKIAAVEARSASSAIREALGGEEHEGEYVAVPARSWRPVKVSVETKTQLRFS